MEEIFRSNKTELVLYDKVETKDQMVSKGKLVMIKTCSFCSAAAEKLFVAPQGKDVAICLDCVTRMYLNQQEHASQNEEMHTAAPALKFGVGEKFGAKIISTRTGGYAISLPKHKGIGFLSTEMNFLIGATVGVVYCRQDGDEHLFAVDYQLLRKL